jgi:hypothetical protein
VAPEGGRYFPLDACCAVFDLLYQRPRCRGLLTSGGKGLAAAVLTAVAALAVPPPARAGHAPALTWLAALAGESAEDVHEMAFEILRCILHTPLEAP